LPERSPTGDPPAGGGDWRVELASGDALVGSIESRDDSAVVMAIGSAATPIRISVRRDSIRHMDRAGESDSYTGPTGLEGWRVSPPHAWRQDAATLTGTPGDIFRIALQKGSLTLESLRVSPWRTADPAVDGASTAAGGCRRHPRDAFRAGR